MDDDRQLFIEVLEAHIRDWDEVAKASERKIHAVELGAPARHSAKTEAEKYRGRIAELRELIEYLRNVRIPLRDVRSSPPGVAVARTSFKPVDFQFLHVVRSIGRSLSIGSRSWYYPKQTRQKNRHAPEPEHRPRNTLRRTVLLGRRGG